MLVISIFSFSYSVFNSFLPQGRLTLSQTSPGFTCLPCKLLENFVGKREIARNCSFSRRAFYPLGELSAIFIKIWNCRLQTVLVWKRLKLVVWEKVKAWTLWWTLLLVIMKTLCWPPFRCTKFMRFVWTTTQNNVGTGKKIARNRQSSFYTVFGLQLCLLWYLFIEKGSADDHSLPDNPLF